MKHKPFLLYVSCLVAATISIMALTSFMAKNNKDNTPARINEQTSAWSRSELKVTTKSIENITSTTADCMYTIQVIGTEKLAITASGASVVKRGEKFSKNFPGRISGSTYKARISGLKPNSIYLVRAYATSANGTVSGYELSFETKAN